MIYRNLSGPAPYRVHRIQWHGRCIGYRIGSTKPVSRLHPLYPWLKNLAFKSRYMLCEECTSELEKIVLNQAGNPENLSSCGVYIICSTNPWTPWYVGQSRNLYMRHETHIDKLNRMVELLNGVSDVETGDIPDMYREMAIAIQNGQPVQFKPVFLTKYSVTSLFAWDEQNGYSPGYSLSVWLAVLEQWLMDTTRPILNMRNATKWIP